MRPLPKYQLNPKIKIVWRISDGLSTTVAFLFLLIPFGIAALTTKANFAITMFTVFLVLYIVVLIVWVVVLPPIRFIRWRYELTKDYLDIARGIIWRRRFIIPFIRVQNTDTRQGPILRAFGLASVVVYTAAGGHEIPGLEVEEAEQLRDRAAELARLAREDV